MNRAAAVAALSILLGGASPSVAAQSIDPAFRDEVITVIVRRFRRSARSLPGDTETIEIDGYRREIGELFETAHELPEPQRGERIYQWFLGDVATAGHFVVREPPSVGSLDPLPKPPSIDGVPKTTVHTLAVRPDGTLVAR